MTEQYDRPLHHPNTYPVLLSFNPLYDHVSFASSNPDSVHPVSVTHLDGQQFILAAVSPRTLISCRCSDSNQSSLSIVNPAILHRLVGVLQALIESPAYAIIVPD